MTTGTYRILFAGTLVAAAGCIAPLAASAAPMTMVFSFPGGFPVSVNKAATVASGPLTFTIQTDNTTPDLDADPFRGRFALSSIVLTAPTLGYANEPIVSPTLFVDTFFGGMTIDDAPVNVDIGWNGGPAPSSFMSDINDLSTLPLPTFISPTTSTFFLQTITLLSGDTIGASVPNFGADGTFLATPEPAGLVLAAIALVGLAAWRRRRK